MANNEHAKDDSGKIFVEHICIEEVVEDLGPPHDIRSKFKTVRDWLYNICDQKKPEKSIAEFRINFFFDESCRYTVFLYGVNIYHETKSRSITRIEFTPSNMYFKVPKHECKKLDLEQFKVQLSSQLKDFTKTKKFQTSFLTKSNKITTEFNGESIWSK